MIGQTLGMYFVLRFAKILFGMLLALLFLIVTVDFIEQLRKISENTDVELGKLYLVSVLRAPAFMEKAFPFGCLFAAMLTLTQLNQKMELVVARAAGVSAWQFILPLGIFAAFTGVLVTTLYNPLAIKASVYSVELTTEIFSGKKHSNNIARNNVWLRQETGKTSAVIQAKVAKNNGMQLEDVKIVEFDERHKVIGRFNAQNANYQNDHWKLSEISQTNSDGSVTKIANAQFPTSLTPDSILSAVSDPENVNFWALKNTAAQVARAGANPRPYLVHYHTLAALPLLLVSMVLIAASVSLKFVRFGQSGRMILGGILSGFVLYTVSKLVVSLGSNGIVPPAVAAWSPSAVAVLFGMSILLHQEDG